MNNDVEQATMAKVCRRLLPFMFLLYVFNFLDRVNVSIAALSLRRDLAMTDKAFGLAVGIFFAGYFVFEIPSNVILSKVGARRWISRIMISWGLVSSATMFAGGATSLSVFRVLLGVAESGFFPGMVLYLSWWFPTRYRARASAVFMVAGPVSGIIGGPLGAWIMKLDGLAGMHGWQWLFLLEGVPSFIMGVICLFYLTDRPSDAGWLLPEQREWLQRQMEAERKTNVGTRRHTLLEGLRNPRILHMTALFLLFTFCGYGVGLWSPQLLQARSGWSDDAVLWLGAIPSVLGMVAMLATSVRSDLRHSRRAYVVAGLVINGLGVLVIAQAHTGWQTLAGFCISGVGGAVVSAPFWAYASGLLTGTAAAGGIALINSVGNLGGLIGPVVMGWLLGLTKSYQSGLLVLAVGVLIAAIVGALLPEKRQSAPV